jgi:uncharacterized membrane-anchored protein
MWAKRLLWAMGTIQILLLTGMLFQLENTRNQGDLFRLELNAYDPYDMFRGNYLALSFKEDRIKTPLGPLQWNEKFYVKLINDKNTGFARPVEVARTFPGGDNWVKVNNSGGSVMEEDDTMLLFSFMQERYFMSEVKIKKAEQALRSATADSNRKCWAEMRVKNGITILTDVKIDGKSLRNWAD